MSDPKPRATYTVLKNGVEFKHPRIPTQSISLNWVVAVIRHLEKDMDRATEHSPYTIGVE